MYPHLHTIAMLTNQSSFCKELGTLGQQIKTEMQRDFA
jgi:hypothetical protein